MGSQLDDRSLYAIAQFLSTDIVQKHDSKLLDNRDGGLPDSTGSLKSPTRIEIPAGGFRDGMGPTKEGYLTKRGKNFGGWQTRYFVLDGPQLKYYDAVYLIFTHTRLTLAEWSSSRQYQGVPSADRSTEQPGSS